MDSHLWAEWVDFWLLLLLGGVPWQCYFQRVLSAKTSKVTFFLHCAVLVSLRVSGCTNEATIHCTRGMSKVFFAFAGEFPHVKTFRYSSTEFKSTVHVQSGALFFTTSQSCIPLKLSYSFRTDTQLDILQSKTASLDGLRKYDTGTSISTSIHTSLGFQRAVFLSYGGCAIAVVMAVPATLFGAVAKATDWSQTEWGHQPDDKEATLVLPLCLQVNVDSQFCNWSRIA